jgi:hypothetical protein
MLNRATNAQSFKIEISYFDGGYMEPANTMNDRSDAGE